MKLSTEIREYVAACFAGLWIRSHEHEDALAEIAELCREESWNLATWDIASGLQVSGSIGDANSASTDPLAAIESINALASQESAALLVLANFNRFMGSAEIVQTLARQIARGKLNRTFVVVLSPVVDVPVELEKHFVVVEHDLPSREQLESIARGIATEDGELPQGVELSRVLDAASGLTRYEAEGAFSLSVVRDGRVLPQAVWRLKSQTLKKSGLLSLHQGGERFDELGGLDSLKRFCTRALAGQCDGNLLKRPRGVLLLGVPGTGKSAFAKSLGNETGRPTLTLDIGSLMGSLVGQTESNIRQALKMADAMAPCVLFIDEIEKALSGVASSGQSDSGVSARLFGTLLSWLNDRTSNVFVVATCNDIRKLPSEFARAERFDGVFFLDLPGPDEKTKIWNIWLTAFQLEADQEKPCTEKWTGAEIRACCRLAALLDLPLTQAARHIVPVAVTASESVARLREWASGRCLSSDAEGIYRSRQAGRRGSSRRSISREPSEN